MRRYRFVTLDVFTDRRFGGNQLAVFPEAEGLSDAEMQALAAEFNLSETTFVLPPSDPANSARVRIFNRVAEMAFAGHPNVGTGYALAEAGRDRGTGLLRFEEMAGLVEVAIERNRHGQVTGTRIGAPQPLAIGAALPVADAASCAGIAADGIVTARHPPTLAADGGNQRLLVEVTPEALAAAAPDIAAFRRTLERHAAALRGHLSLYLYRAEGAGYRARMFSPLSGTWEDAATGSAATPLAGFLLHLSGAEAGRWEIWQGVEMGRPSLLRAAARRAADGAIRAEVGGGCVPVLEGWARL
jgi:trans-2,3-dihydro-3-hydroxyanthranilate isomerase